jgi:hypothetical protein
MLPRFLENQKVFLIFLSGGIIAGVFSKKTGILQG